ncbi:DNA-directed RNA polymerase subunit beta [Paenibacillus sediminis]|uniref:DNA-directed RNA polymerase subunit beta n=1 Tax=Paenibacillus sediminis TaxID=664909 RepID=A0ABS4H2S6_9BACL|nr:DNA-directed RNA polymerase subunit beta [Paenibacillus sediminis]MBP1936687.1 hypothetical protein [Paenibacillus sediminis]
MSEQDKPARKKTSRKWVIAVRIMIPFLFIIAILGGLIIGYVVIGKQSIHDVFHMSTWRHLFDLIFAE